jgi:hypothetical protein
MSSSPPGAPVQVIVLWEWEGDRPFVSLFADRCSRLGLSLVAIGEQHVKALWAAGLGPAPRLVLDRASDVVPELEPLLAGLAARGTRVVNDAAKMSWCRDKATMHLELLTLGVDVPHGIILSAGECANGSAEMAGAAETLGVPFVIKPAEGGGGDGVVLDATHADQVLGYLKRTGYDKVILQRRVAPQSLGGRRAWFRVVWAAGRMLPCWWDDLTHAYEPLAAEDEARFNLGALRSITSIVAGVTGIDLFTTEIALDSDGRLVVVDFVNEMPDLRPQELFADGVPAVVLGAVADALLGLCGAADSPPVAPAAV